MRHLLMLVFLSSVSMADDLDKKLEKDFCRVHRISVVELCQKGCYLEVMSIPKNYPNDLFLKEKYNKKLMLEEHRCEQRCERIE